MRVSTFTFETDSELQLTSGDGVYNSIGSVFPFLVSLVGNKWKTEKSSFQN